MKHDVFPDRCEHGSAEQPCCHACTTLREAEAVLVDVSERTIRRAQQHGYLTTHTTGIPMVTKKGYQAF